MDNLHLLSTLYTHYLQMIPPVGQGGGENPSQLEKGSVASEMRDAGLLALASGRMSEGQWSGWRRALVSRPILSQLGLEG